MNKSDSERIAAVLQSIGYKKTLEIDRADLIVVNMCSVRQSAVDRVYGLFSKSKTQIKNKKVILTGCILPSDRKKLENKVDLILNIKNLVKLPELLKTTAEVKLLKNYLSIPPLLTSSVSAYVPIMTGCNNFCAYCVVPYVRGEEISRPAQEIIEETKKLIKKGYKEIILLGQNVNSYKDKNINFPKLLKLINDLPGKFWIRFITSHPKDLSDELIEIIADGEKITEYLHLPVQAGSDEILKKMNRGYTIEDYKNLIRKIRAQKVCALVRHKSTQAKNLPFSISTDIIVGFPGETKKQFKQTVKLMKWAKFDMVYTAQYSHRLMTAAFKLKDDVIKKEKRRREQILTKILKKTALKNNKKYINKTIEVLIEQTPHHPPKAEVQWQAKNNSYMAKTRTFKNVKISARGGSALGGKDPKGFFACQFVKVKIVKATPWGLEGKLIK